MWKEVPRSRNSLAEVYLGEQNTLAMTNPMPCATSRARRQTLGVWGKERWKEGKTYKGCCKVLFLAYSGYAVQELAEADCLRVMGADYSNQGTCLGFMSPGVETDVSRCRMEGRQGWALKHKSGIWIPSRFTMWPWAWQLMPWINLILGQVTWCTTQEWLRCAWSTY